MIKTKTAFQMVSIIVIIMVLIVRSFLGKRDIKILSDDIMKFDKVYEILNSFMPLQDKLLIIAPYCLMALVTLITALSGLRYIITNWRLFLLLSYQKDKSLN